MKTIYRFFFLSRQTWLRGPHAAPTIEDYWPIFFFIAYSLDPGACIRRYMYAHTLFLSCTTWIRAHASVGACTHILTGQRGYGRIRRRHRRSRRRRHSLHRHLFISRKAWTRTTASVVRVGRLQGRVLNLRGSGSQTIYVHERRTRAQRPSVAQANRHCLC